MHWWDETEGRALRARGTAQLALVLWRRLQDAGCSPELALLPAHGLAALHGAGSDLVQVVESLLVAPQGALRLYLLELAMWCRRAAFAVTESERPFLLLLDSLKLDPADLDRRSELPPGAAAAPAEQPKLEGRYQRRHLLYERLDLKLEAGGIPAPARQPLCRDLATVYEEFLVLLRVIHRLQGEDRVRFGELVRLLVDLNATFHFTVGPRYLQPLRVEAGAQPGLGLPGWIALALGPDWPEAAVFPGNG